MWDEFLRRVWGEQKGWAYIAYIGNDGLRQRAFKYPEQLDYIIEDLTKFSQWANVYFCPHLFKEPRRQKDAALPLHALWVDKDTGPVEEIHPKPTICWRTSPGKHQAVWLLKEPVDPYEGEKINRFLTYVSHADKGGWYLGKLVRLPESQNFKYTPPAQGVLLWDDGPTYNLSDLKPTSAQAQDFLAV